MITSATDRRGVSAEASEGAGSWEHLQSTYILLVPLELLTPCPHTVLEEKRVFENAKCPDWDFETDLAIGVGFCRKTTSFLHT